MGTAAVRRAVQRRVGDDTQPLDTMLALARELGADLAAGTTAERLAQSLPRGLPAIVAYFQGDRDFRRGAYQSAVQNLERVIELDSTYAPAHSKRMLAIVQLSPGEVQIHLCPMRSELQRSWLPGARLRSGSASSKSPSPW